MVVLRANYVTLLLLIKSLFVYGTDYATHAQPKEYVYNNFTIIIPSYNNNHLYRGKLLFEKNLDSVFSQNYPYYRVIYIDDCSPDGTGKCVNEYILQKKQTNRVTLILNQTQKGQAENRYKAAHACNDNEIIVLLDGDDYFADNNVLSFLNDIYQDKNIWMTYGQFRQICQECIELDYSPYVNRSNSCKHKYYYCAELPPKEIIDKNELRKYIVETSPANQPQIFGHPLTFYAKLFKKIKFEDLTVNGIFYKRGTDTSVIIPIAEMAGHHIRFVPEILYIWTFDNFTQHYGSFDPSLVFWHDEMIRKKPYEPLKELFS